jgi:hypothetical protein
MIVLAYFLSGIKNIVQKDQTLSFSYVDQSAILNKEKYYVQTNEFDIAFRFEHFETPNNINITGQEHRYYSL